MARDNDRLNMQRYLHAIPTLYLVTMCRSVIFGVIIALLFSSMLDALAYRSITIFTKMSKCKLKLPI